MLPYAPQTLVGGARSFIRQQEAHKASLIAKGVGRRVYSPSSLSPGPHTSFAGRSKMQAHTPEPSGESEVGVNAALAARGWGLAASWRGRRAARGNNGVGLLMAGSKQHLKRWRVELVKMLRLRQNSEVLMYERFSNANTCPGWFITWAMRVLFACATWADQSLYANRQRLHSICRCHWFLFTLSLI